LLGVGHNLAELPPPLVAHRFIFKLADWQAR
jgi:hypothetical protein